MKKSQILKTLIMEIAGEEEKHVIDREVYENSGGGSMCENCGCGIYNPDWELPCPTERNKWRESILKCADNKELLERYNELLSG
jgi:hypothetical protein